MYQNVRLTCSSLNWVVGNSTQERFPFLTSQMVSFKLLFEAKTKSQLHINNNEILLMLITCYCTVIYNSWAMFLLYFIDDTFYFRQISTLLPPLLTVNPQAACLCPHSATGRSRRQTSSHANSTGHLKESLQWTFSSNPERWLEMIMINGGF